MLSREGKEATWPISKVGAAHTVISLCSDSATLQIYHRLSSTEHPKKSMRRESYGGKGRCGKVGTHNKQ